MSHRANFFGLRIPFTQMMCGSTTAFRLAVSWVTTFFEDSKSHMKGNKFHAKNPGMRFIRFTIETKIYEAKALLSALAGPSHCFSLFNVDLTQSIKF